jgi:hypothetical protein
MARVIGDDGAAGMALCSALVQRRNRHGHVWDMPTLLPHRRVANLPRLPTLATC